jgi:hypothetical protein
VHRCRSVHSCDSLHVWHFSDPCFSFSCASGSVQCLLVDMFDTFPVPFLFLSNCHSVDSSLIYSFLDCLFLTFCVCTQGTRLLAFERRVAFAVARVRSATALRAAPPLTDSSSSSPSSSSSSSSSSSLLSPSPLDRLAAQRRSADADDGTGFGTGGANDDFDSPTNMPASATTTTTTNEHRFDWTAAELLQSFEREVRAAHADRDAIAQVRVCACVDSLSAKVLMFHYRCEQTP